SLSKGIRNESEHNYGRKAPGSSRVLESINRSAQRGRSASEGVREENERNYLEANAESAVVADTQWSQSQERPTQITYSKSLVEKGRTEQRLTLTIGSENEHNEAAETEFEGKKDSDKASDTNDEREAN